MTRFIPYLASALLLASTAYAAENLSWGQVKALLEGQTLPAAKALPTAGGGGGRASKERCEGIKADLGADQFSEHFGSFGQCVAMAKLWDFYSKDFKSDSGAYQLFCNHPIGAKILTGAEDDGFWAFIAAETGLVIDSAAACHTAVATAIGWPQDQE